MHARITEEIKSSRIRFLGIEADVFRAFGEVHKAYPIVSLLWYLRAASKYQEGGYDLVRSMLDNVCSSLEKLEYRFQIQQQMEEIRGLIRTIDREGFSTEIAAIERHIDRVYARTVTGSDGERIQEG